MRTNFEHLLTRRYSEIRMKRMDDKNSEIKNKVEKLNEEHREKCVLLKQQHEILSISLKIAHEENMERLREERDKASSNNKRALESYLLASSIILNKKPRTAEAKDVVSAGSHHAGEIENK